MAGWEWWDRRCRILATLEIRRYTFSLLAFKAWHRVLMDDQRDAGVSLGEVT